MSLNKALQTYKDYFNEKIETYGATPQGVDYNGPEAQQIRLVASSIFNNKFEATEGEWQEMVLQTLQRMNRLSTKGFSFDMLTKYSDADRMALRPDLFFADPLLMFDFCKRNFSRNVALLHDYGLYDFTILVRKDV